MKNLEIKNVDCHATLAMTKNTQSGRSMIEMLGVLAIIGVLSVGGIAGYSKAMMKYRINKTIEQITLITGNIRSFFASQGNYEGLYCGCSGGSCTGQSDGDGCPVIKKAKILPDEMITVNSAGKITEITNAFGGSFHVDGNSTYFSLWIYSLPIDACIELVSQDWSSAGIDYIGVNYNSRTMYSLKTPASVDDAVDICTRDTESDNKENMVFNFECKDCWIKECTLENGGCM